MVYLVLTIKVRGTPMRKIHHGFIAIVILAGPARLILTHEKLTRTTAQEVFDPFDPPSVL